MQSSLILHMSLSQFFGILNILIFCLNRTTITFQSELKLINHKYGAFLSRTVFGQ